MSKLFLILVAEIDRALNCLHKTHGARLAWRLHPNDLDQIVEELRGIFESGDREVTCSVAIERHTVRIRGVLLVSDVKAARL